MTSTSFNPIAAQTQALSTNQPLAMKQGQLFHGTVKQLYPDQMAEIQVGQQKFVAKLEAPLKAGDTHFFSGNRHKSPNGTKSGDRPDGTNSFFKSTNQSIT